MEVVGGKERTKLNIMFMNAQSVGNKMDELRALVAINKPDVIAITETWTNETIADAFLQINGYEMAARDDRNDTAGGRGGEILVYTAAEMCVWKGESPENFNQGVTINLRHRCEDVKIHVIYRSPNSKRENDEALNEWVNDMRGTNIIIGDLNYPDIDWDGGTAGSRGRGFLEATQNRFMEQYVTEPTHVSGNILDVILCDKEDLIRSVKMEGRIGKSDHDMISFDISIEKIRNNEKGMRLNYGRANYIEMREAMRKEDWVENFKGKNVNDAWLLFKSRVEGLIKKYVPMTKVKKNNDPPWMNINIKKMH